MPSVTVNREKLLQCLESVAPGLASRETVEQSSCFVFQGGVALTYDGEVAYRCPSGLPNGLTGAVRGEPLLELLRQLPEEEVGISNGNAELVIDGKGRRGGLRLESEVLLPVGQLERPAAWAKLHEEFGEAVTLVSRCAGKNREEFILTCVHLHPDYVEATDDVQLAHWKLKTGLSASTTVRAGAVGHIATLGMTEVGETQNWVHFRNPAGLILSCRRAADQFLDTGPSLAPAGGASVALPKGLVEAAAKGQIFSKDAEDDKVIIELRPGELRLTGTGNYGWYKERKPVKWAGEPIKFLIAPDLLAQIVKDHSEVTVLPDRLRVDGGKFIYICALGYTGNEK